MGDDTKRLRELLKRATPGPWCDEGLGALLRFGEKQEGPWHDLRSDFHWLPGPNDAALIVELRNQADSLLDAADERDSLRAEVARLQADIRARLHSIVHALRESPDEAWRNKKPDEPCSEVNYLQHIRHLTWLASELRAERDDLDCENDRLVAANEKLYAERNQMQSERDALRAEVARLREALLETRRIGAQLANIAYNLAQRETLDEQARSSCDSTRRAWDALPKPAALGDADGG